MFHELLSLWWSCHCKAKLWLLFTQFYIKTATANNVLIEIDSVMLRWWHDSHPKEERLCAKKGYVLIQVAPLIEPRSMCLNFLQSLETAVADQRGRTKIPIKIVLDGHLFLLQRSVPYQQIFNKKKQNNAGKYVTGQHLPLYRIRCTFHSLCKHNWASAQTVGP